MGKNPNYSTKDIIKLDDIKVIQKNTSMYIGSTENPNHLLMEALDNVLDEVQAGFCNKLSIEIDGNAFKVKDWGRGFPFDQKLPIEKDPPILSCTEMSTSGKFNKDVKDSPYKIASGLHGIGLTAINALSDKLKMEIYRDKKHATYEFKKGKFILRKQNAYKSEPPFSTMIYAIPNKKYFKSIHYDIDKIIERLKLAKIAYPKLEIECIIDGKQQEINSTIYDILHDLSATSKDNWFRIQHTDKKKIESYDIWFTWDEKGSVMPKAFTSVNLVPVHSGVHLNKFYNTLKKVFNVKKFKFEKDDCLVGLRCYIDLRIVNTAFDAQVKVRLESKSDISIMDNLESKLLEWKKQNQDQFEYLCQFFEAYRKQRNASLLKAKNNKTRGSTKYTKLKDCTKPGGELLIGEGDSAISGLNSIRDITKHAILPLRGVIPNAITMDTKKLIKNDVISDLVNAIGTGIHPHVKIENIRYSKILLAADADPAGKFITTLLIMFFAKYIPEVIKESYLYVCKTPLYGIGKNDTFKPIWTEKELNECRNKGIKIRRFKGLGEFNPPEIFRFTLGKDRQLDQVKWTKKLDKLEKLLSSSEYKRQLLDNKFKI